MADMTGFYYSFMLSLAFFGLVTAPPVPLPSISSAFVQMYLRNYGYTTADNPTVGDIMSGMRAMQRFHGLDETGEMDEMTLTDMSRPRCGVPDINPAVVPPPNCTEGEQGGACRRRRRFTILGVAWDSTSLTYRFNNYTPDLSPTVTLSAIERALRVWADVTPLTFARRADGTDRASVSDIEIVFGGQTHTGDRFDSPFDGPSQFGGTVLAHAFNPGSVRFADIRGDMHFDEDELWEDAAGIDLFTVAAHEFGHSLGLGHSNVRGALMFPTYYGYNPDFRLHEDDVLGIQFLYGPAPITQRAPTTTLETTQSISTKMSSTKPMTEPEVILDICKTNYITATTLESVYDDSTTVVISDQKVWRIATEENLISDVYMNSRVSTFDALWEGMTDPLSALFEKQDGTLVVIRGLIYWEYTHDRQMNFQLKSQFPKLLSSIGLPDNAEIMAALTNRDEGQIFLFSDTMYWTFNGNLDAMTNPQSLIRTGWQGVPDGINAAFNWKGNSYFVKGNDYWRYNSTISEVDGEFLDQFNANWLDCPASSSSTISQSFTRGLIKVMSYCMLVLLLTSQR